MRKVFFLIIMNSLMLIAYGQAPESIKYQAVARQGNGILLINRQITFRISFIKNNLTGPVVYSETHTGNSNEFGLVALDLGRGTPITGTFSSIEWEAGPYFIEVAIDPTGASSFTVMGTSELLSVPYALYAKKAANGFSGEYEDLKNKPMLFDGDYNSLSNKPVISNGDYNALSNKPTKLSNFTNDTGFISNSSESLLKLSTTERDALENIANGMLIFNTTSGCLNLRNGSLWFELCGVCTPQPTASSAGDDKSNVIGSVTLDGNTPLIGTGTWTKISGTGGSFENANQPNTTFTGEPGQTYTLRWSITNACGSNSDDVQINFTSNEPNIGDLYGGGIVFYKFPEGGGLVAALSDQSVGAPWGCFGTTIGQLGTTIGSGSTNTERIISVCTESGTAAKICNELVLNGYSDWYLPSSSEMYQLTQALSLAQSGLSAGHQYWGSNENNGQYAPYVEIMGAGLSQEKSNLLRVRAIRTFPPVQN